MRRKRVEETVEVERVEKERIEESLKGTERAVSEVAPYLMISEMSWGALNTRVGQYRVVAREYGQS